MQTLVRNSRFKVYFRLLLIYSLKKIFSNPLNYSYICLNDQLNETLEDALHQLEPNGKILLEVYFFVY